jgi:hypothetical protein
MSSPHAPSGHPHPDPAGPILQGPGLLLPALSPKPPEFISGPRHWGAGRGLQDGPRVTAAPREGGGPGRPLVAVKACASSSPRCLMLSSLYREVDD